MRNARIVAAIAALAAFACGALPCRAEPPAAASLELIRPLGDTYNERSTDGDAYPQSLGIRLLLARRDYAVTLQYWRNVYLTESGGPGALTRYARLEGGFGTVAPFIARDSSFETHAMRRISAGVPLYAGVGAVRTWTNYHYPSLTGVGPGVELRAAAGAGARPFVSAFYYPSASGTYVTETPPARTLTPRFVILKVDFGVVIRGKRSHVFGVVGDAQEVRTGQGLSSDNRFIRSDPYASIGVRM
ncbi:MAG: hypothetical protein QOF71_2808 [Candidatus Eremiobacteraeota bacterium]|nr:hypothetical protein [Candidatus Eremiobacteraeota bacterium]